MTSDNAALQAKLDKAVEALEEISKTQPYQGTAIEIIHNLQRRASDTLKELTND